MANNLFNINSKSILATASITITDQSDAANLAGNISIIQSSKNQVYITGSSNPFSPDWTKQNLVLKPYMYASTIVRGKGTVGEYTPDLFSPDEYPDLDNPGDPNVSTSYINELFWYLRDANGSEHIINPAEDIGFDYNYEYNGRNFNDKRFLVIRRNFIARNSFATIICKFSFYDPFAKIFIKQNYEIDLSCLATGLGANQLLLNAPKGTSIYNSYPDQIELEAEFYKNGIKVDVQEEIENGAKSSGLFWFVRSHTGDGWTLLDGTKQDQYSDLFEVCRYTHFDKDTNAYVLAQTTSARGGFCLKVKPGLIDGSSVIKAVFSSSDDNMNYNALEVVYDTTDDVQAYIHSSNGDKIYQGMESIGTVLTCMLKYQGQLMDSNDSRYETNFEYYWFKISSDGSRTWNIWLNNEGELLSQEFVQGEQITMKASSRVLPIKANHVDNVNMFQCAVIDKAAEQMAEQRANFILNSPSEEDLRTAALLNAELGLPEDNVELLNTAYEINAMHIADNTSLKD